MLRVLVLFSCLVVACLALQCYQCDTKEDDVTSCAKTVCNGLKAVCYKREYEFESDSETVKQYEERGCVEDEDLLAGSCKKELDTLMESVEKCKIYTCADNRCNSSFRGVLSFSLLSALIVKLLL